MTKALFSFSGSIERDQFMRWGVFQSVTSILILLFLKSASVENFVARQFGSDSLAMSSRISIELLLWFMLVLLPSSALIVKRLRSLGVSAWPSIAAIVFVDMALAAALPNGSGVTGGPLAALAFTALAMAVLAQASDRRPSKAKPSDELPAWAEHVAS